MAKRRKPTNHKTSPAHQSQKRILQETQVYVMHNIPLFWINKFGITDNTGARQRSVSETTKGFVFPVFAPTLAFGWECEQFVHALYAFQDIRLSKGSGKQEWFLVFSPAVGTLVLLASNYLHFDLGWKVYTLAYFTPFVWWDGWFWLLVFSLLRMIIYLLIFAGIVYAVKSA